MPAYALTMSLPGQAFSRRLHGIIQGFTTAESGNIFDRMHLVSQNVAGTSKEALQDAHTQPVDAASIHMASIQMAMIGLQQRRTMSILVGIRDLVGPQTSTLDSAPLAAAAASMPTPAASMPTPAAHQEPSAAAGDDAAGDEARRQRVLASVARRAAAREFLEATLQGVPDVRFHAAPPPPSASPLPHASAAHPQAARSSSPP